jgi:hypothetical protein
MVTTSCSRHLACVGTTKVGTTLVVAYDADTGNLLGVVCGPAIVPTLPPEGWTPAPMQAWQVVYHFPGRTLHGMPFHAGDAVHAARTWQAIRSRD